MRFSATSILNCTTVAGVASLMFAGAYYSNSYIAGVDGVDTMTTASVTAHAGAQPQALADQFTVLNHMEGRSCVLRLHRAEGYDVHRVEPAENCSAVASELVPARAWQENAIGMVTITDRSGNTLMKLSRSDGFAWDVVEPTNVAISLEAF